MRALARIGLSLGLEAARRRGEGGAPAPIQLVGASFLNPAFAFARASAATFFNTSGVPVQVGNNVQRFDATGLIFEGGRTNLNLRSRLAGGTGWTNANITASLATGPDGIVGSANRLDEGTVNSFHTSSAGNASFVTGVTYPLSAVVKAETCTTCQLIAAGGAFGTTAWQNFDLSSGTLGTGGTGALSPRIMALGGGWFWISMACTAIATIANAALVIGMTPNATSGRNASYVGTSRTMLVHWAWVEDNAAFPSRTILAATEPNTSSRVADTAAAALSALGVTNTAFTFWGRSTLMATPGGTDLQRFFRVDDAGDSSRCDLFYDGAAGGIRGQLRINATSATQHAASLFAPVAGQSFGWAVSLDTLAPGDVTRMAVSIEGSAASPLARTGPITTPYVTARLSGNHAVATPFFGGHQFVRGRSGAALDADLPALSLAA